MKKSARPKEPNNPFAKIRVESGGKFAIWYGVGWGSYGTIYRRSIKGAVRVRDRKLKQMQKIADRTKWPRWRWTPLSVAPEILKP